MLRNVVDLQRKRFYQRKSAAMYCTAPVLPLAEKHLAYSLQKSRPYKKSVSFVEGTDIMEATVVSMSDDSEKKRVDFSNEKQTITSCCMY